MSAPFDGALCAVRSLVLVFARPKRWLFAASAFVGTSLFAWALVNDTTLIALLHPSVTQHTNQGSLHALVVGGNPSQAFLTAFAHGDQLFETKFTAVDGVGANVGQGQRFTRVPRADMHGVGEWANHFPSRATGPNAQSCASCHSEPSQDGAGGVAANVHRDPLHTGQMSSFIERSTPHTFGEGAVQRLAEEMTAELQVEVAAGEAQCCQSGHEVHVHLEAKGVSFGTVDVTRTGTNPCTTHLNTAQVHGISSDLIVRPFQWKGSVAFLRDFNRGAAHNEIGMQGVELVGDNVDGDGDGVVNELTVGDITALTIYVAAQPRPTTKVELNALGLLTPALTSSDITQIRHGQMSFRAIGCANCHVPTLTVDDPIFSEPSQSASYRDAVFPAGQDPVALGVDPAHPIAFDLTSDQTENHILDPQGNLLINLGAFKRDAAGHALVELYGDLKRHDMGPGLAETIDEVGTGASVFLTKNLWGVGSTAPYLHDGRATTLTEAILDHGGDAATARAAFLALSTTQKTELIAFLNNLVLFKQGD